MTIQSHQVRNLRPAIKKLELEPYVLQLQLQLDGLAIVSPEVIGVKADVIDQAVELLLADSANIRCVDCFSCFDFAKWTCLALPRCLPAGACVSYATSHGQ